MKQKIFKPLSFPDLYIHLNKLTCFQMSIDPYSQASLTFVEDVGMPDYGADTQGLSEFDNYMFTLPSQTQATQTQPSQLSQNGPTSESAPTNIAASMLAGLTLDDHGESDDDDEEKDAKSKEPPEYACTYCGIHDPSAVVMCNATNKWFCNGRGNTSGR